MGVWYTPSRDGTIADYVRYCNSEHIPPCFRGSSQFQQLVDLGYLVENLSSIRIVYGDARGDEFYIVVEDFRLEGVKLHMHSGKEGIHDPRTLLSGRTPYYWVEGLNPHPEPRAESDKTPSSRV